MHVDSWGHDSRFLRLVKLLELTFRVFRLGNCSNPSKLRMQFC